MNKEIKKQWVEALRSNNYTQNKGMLRDESRFCALGVLCDLHSKSTNTPWNDLKYLGECWCLPKEVADWAEFSHWEYISRDNKYVPCSNGYNVCDVNDEPKSFKEIADNIEEKF